MFCIALMICNQHKKRKVFVAALLWDKKLYSYKKAANKLPVPGFCEAYKERTFLFYCLCITKILRIQINRNDCQYECLIVDF